LVTSFIGTAFSNMSLKEKNRKIKVTGRGGRRRKQLLDDLMEKKDTVN